MTYLSWHLLVGAGEGAVAGAEGKGGFRLQVVTPCQPCSCLSTLPGSLVLPGMIFSQTNADLVRQLCQPAPAGVMLESRYSRVNPHSLNSFISPTA